MALGKNGNFIAIYVTAVEDGEDNHLLDISMAPVVKEFASLE